MTTYIRAVPHREKADWVDICGRRTPSRYWGPKRNTRLPAACACMATRRLRIGW